MTDAAGGPQGPPMGPRYHRLRIRLPGAHEEVDELEDLVAAWAWERGTAGIEFQSGAAGESLLIATFEAEKFPANGDLRDLASLVPGVEVVDFGPVEEQDWLAAWRDAAGPIELGSRLVVDPREWEGGAETLPPASRSGPRAAGARGERFVLAIPARTAFGVGSHESTRLAYELLEATPLAGKRVLDVGCGSGILAMAALLLGARAAVGFDFDPAAGLLAGQYARHNGLAPAIFTGTVAALATPATEAARFEVVVLNVLPHEIAEELEQVIAQLASGGNLLVSGVLVSEAEAVRSAIERLGCDLAGQVAAGEWVGLRFFRRPELATVLR
ncbi:MAG: ribosomal protein methyltransferase [Acidobacteriota bacterium]|nr:ribosomal protein methyltransferase [Acidobacteriota bacterium]